jgi:hypothetical protein
VTDAELQRVVAQTCAEYIRPLIPMAEPPGRNTVFQELYTHCDLTHFRRDPMALYPTVEQMADFMVRNIWESQWGIFKGPSRYPRDGYFHECRGLWVHAVVATDFPTLTVRIFGAKA